MGIFDSIKNAIFGHHETAAATPAAGAAPTTAAPGTGTVSTVTPTAAAAAAAAPTPALSAGALETQLGQLAAKNGQKLNWQTSIVDLMKLVGLDPSLTNRKQLAQELGYTGDTADSASMNIWLHKTVMEKLQASGGKVTADLK